jgi:very-short-patch-repair endonuclease
LIKRKWGSKVSQINPHPLGPPLPETGEGEENTMSEEKNVFSGAAKKLRHNLTEEEKILWERLRNRKFNGLKFRRQEAVGKFVADFICYERKILIELDGSHHMEQKERDAERDSWFSGQGYKVIRFWNHEVTEDIEGVQERIKEHLK